jgi:CRP-like cAMP-binding protein
MKPLMQNISDDLTAAIIARGHKRTFYEGEMVFEVGSAAAFLPIILSGSVKMLHPLDGGKEMIVGIFREGEMFAVPPVFDGKNYPSTAVALEKSDLLLLSRGAFLELLRESSEFAFAVIRWTTDMLRDKTAAIETLATASPDQRVGKVLLKLAGDGGAATRITLRREDIARMAGLTTETTIRVVRRLAKQGVLVIEHGKIIIDDREPLRRLATG